jgi:hypothetical protein
MASDRCQFYAHSSYTVCAVHPNGVQEKSCIDFREDPNPNPQELWEPEGASYIDDNLVLERSYYNGEEIALPQRQLTPEQHGRCWNRTHFSQGIALDVAINSPATFLSLFTLTALNAAGLMTPCNLLL